MAVIAEPVAQASRASLMSRALESKNFLGVMFMLPALAILVLFLGYAFHRLNCGRLLPKRWGPHQRPQMFGTSFHMLAGAVAKGRSYFENQGPKPELFDVDCLGLLQRIEDRFSE